MKLERNATERNTKGKQEMPEGKQSHHKGNKTSKWNVAPKKSVTERKEWPYI